jgi:hypothetical protein
MARLADPATAQEEYGRPVDQCGSGPVASYRPTDN